MHEPDDQELEDRAYYGMTYFEEDPYTSYMSSSELEPQKEAVEGFKAYLTRYQALLAAEKAAAAAEKKIISAVMAMNPCEEVTVEVEFIN